MCVHISMYKTGKDKATLAKRRFRFCNHSLLPVKMYIDNIPYCFDSNTFHIALNQTAYYAHNVAHTKLFFCFEGNGVFCTGVFTF